MNDDNDVEHHFYGDGDSETSLSISIHEVIVSSYSEITENECLDPRTAQVAIVDHVKQICTKVRPANDEELPSLYIEEYRYALDAEIQRYVSELSERTVFD